MAHKTPDEWVLEALKVARGALIADGRDVTPSAIVFRALEEAMETSKRLPDPEAGWLYSVRTMWPEVLGDYGDKVESYKSMLERIMLGIESPEALHGRPPRPSPAQIARMEAVTEQFPKYLQGRNRRRDWQILVGYARDFPVKHIARLARCDRKTCLSQKTMQTGRIAAHYEALFPDAFPAGLRPDAAGTKPGSGNVLQSQLSSG